MKEYTYYEILKWIVDTAKKVDSSITCNSHVSDMINTINNFINLNLQNKHEKDVKSNKEKNKMINNEYNNKYTIKSNNFTLENYLDSIACGNFIINTLVESNVNKDIEYLAMFTIKNGKIVNSKRNINTVTEHFGETIHKKPEKEIKYINTFSDFLKTIDGEKTILNIINKTNSEFRTHNGETIDEKNCEDIINKMCEKNELIIKLDKDGKPIHKIEAEPIRTLFWENRENYMESAKPFYNLIEHIVNTFENKNIDYAGSDKDYLFNFHQCENWGIDIIPGLVTRISDKISRTQSLMRTGKQHVKDESLIDTWTDLAVYSIILVTVLKMQGNKNGK